jgi:hypothetical protein
MRWRLVLLLLLLPAIAHAQPVSTVEADQTIDLVREGRLDILRQELRTSRAAAIVNAENENQMTPFLSAIEAAKPEIFQVLLNVGGNAKDPRALLLAARSGGLPYVEMLLANGANANAADGDGWTALHAACRAGNADVVALLLKKGANPNAAAKPDGWRPIHEAVWRRARPVLDALLDDKRTLGTAPDAQGWTALHLAVELESAARDDGEFVATLLSRAHSKLDASAGLGETPTSLRHTATEGGSKSDGESGKDALFAGDGLGCARLDGGGVLCWGDVNHAVKATQILRLGRVEQMAIAHHRVCALSRGTSGANAVRCWGDNPDGSLGVGSTRATIDRPMVVPGLRDAVSLGVGKDFSCVVLKDGSVRCWGGANAGIWLGGAPGKAGQPVTIAGLANAVAVATTDNSACVLDKPGRVRCWGHGALGQLGHGQLHDSATPVEVKLPGPALALTAGSDQVCARLQTGRAMCWGFNELGQLGNGASVFEGKVQDAGDRSPLPVAVVGVSGLTHLVASGSQTCAIVSGARPGALCWGGAADKAGEADMTGAPRYLHTGAIKAIAVDPRSGWLLDAAGRFLHWGMSGKQWLSKPILER